MSESKTLYDRVAADLRERAAVERSRRRESSQPRCLPRMAASAGEPRLPPVLSSAERRSGQPMGGRSDTGSVRTRGATEGQLGSSRPV